MVNSPGVNITKQFQKLSGVNLTRARFDIPSYIQ